MKYIFVIILTLLAAKATPQGKGTEQADVVVIVNARNPLEKMTATEVRNYWMRKGAQRIWPGLNEGVKPADRKSSCEERDTFYKRMIGLSQMEIESYFAAKQYQNADQPPKKFASDAEILAYVAEHVGAIGFVSRSSLAGNKGVKIVYEIQE